MLLLGQHIKSYDKILQTWWITLIIALVMNICHSSGGWEVKGQDVDTLGVW